MGPGPDSEQPTERTRLIDPPRGSSTQRQTSKYSTSSQDPTQVRESTGSVGFLHQVALLLWKNVLQQKRSVKVTVAEILLPLLGAVIMLVIRQVIDVSETSTPTTWTADSLGPLAAKTLNDTGKFMLYAPNSTLINSVMADVNTSLSNDGLGATVLGFGSEDDIIRFYRLDGVMAANYPITVIFDIDPSATTLPRDLTYKIRPRTEDDDKWDTKRVFSFYQVLSPREDDKGYYYNRSFVYTQRIVSEALIRYWEPGAVGELEATSWNIQKIPYPPYINDAMVQVLQQNFPSVLMLSFILSVIVMCKNIVYEKERQLKESMKLMGMSAAAHWVSWFLQFFIYLVLACAIYTLFMAVGVGSKKPVLVYSDPSMMFVFLLLYSISIITYSFFISTLSSKANTGAAIGGILFFAAFFPYYFLEQRYEDLTLGEKLGACVLFNMAMSYGMKTIGLYEGTGNGAQWDSFTQPASVDDNFSLMHAMIMLAIDSVIFLTLTWYLDNVRPGTYGVPRPWYFPFQPSYWCGGGRKRTFSRHETVQGADGERFEREPTGLPVGISMVHLRKEFGKNKVAVKDSTLTMFEGQITVLLGHNGAGKTTTMSMLTGFLPPTSGTAFVNGFDIRSDINSVRSNLGLCPQHNILFETLTVDEHLTFFAQLKGHPKKDIEAAVAAMAKEVGLELKRNALAGTLSGGQKRKLSVGIALIGGSKIVILDEPTSGMDPAARRQTWDVLQRHRAGRTMLLSTHFMDEADLLGDRIAIMAEGVVKCCGTSMFLKKLYGAGYHLVMVKGPHCDVSAVTTVVQSEVPGAYVESEVGAELSYLLPEDSVARFPKLFSIIEEQLDKLGITSFGTSATTMEEVFLKVGASGSKEDANDREESLSRMISGSATINGFRKPVSTAASPVDGHVSPNYTDESDMDGTGIPKSSSDRNGTAVSPAAKAMNGASAPDTVLDASNLTANLALNNSYTRLKGFNLDMSRFLGMFVKKAIHTFRNRVISAVQLALPVIFTIAALTVDKVRPKDTEDPPRTLDLGMFDGTISAYTTGINSSALSEALGSSYSTLFSGGDNTIQSINRTQFPDINDFYVSQAAEVGLFTYNKKVVIGAEFQSFVDGSDINATAWYSGQPFHAMPVSVAFLMNSFARQLTGEEHTMTFINHPMPKGELAAAQDSMLVALQLGFSIGFSMLFGMAFLTSSFCYFLIRERQTGAKHLQVVSGVGPFAFWVASLAWDIVNYMIPCLVLLVVFAAFQVDAYTEDGNLGLVLLILIVFGIAVVPFTYVLQFPFSTPATGFVVLIILSIVSGLFTMLTVFIMRIPSLKVADIADILDWIFMALFPHYSLGMGFSNFYINKLDMDFCINPILNLDEVCPQLKRLNRTNPCCKDICEDFCLPFEKNFLAWDYPGIGRNVFFMCIQGIVFFSLVLAIDFQLPQKLMYWCRGKGHTEPSPSQGISNPQYPGPSYNMTEDEDVALERQRLSSGGAQSDTLVLDSLYKQYGPFVAVDHISVGVPEQECFGLLGQNGAGKTTTFKMLTGDVMLSEGDASVRQYSVKTDIKQVQANMGYCPQFDALIDQMTGRETLTMYARLRGVPSSHISSIVNNLLTLLMLEPHADKWTLHYRPLEDFAWEKHPVEFKPYYKTLLSENLGPHYREWPMQKYKCLSKPTANIDQMTGRETLTMYARLRGVPSSHISSIVNNLLTLLMLEPHADKWTLHYSGGNKRKLSTAVALVGGPAVILLDEPSSGMDPAARRQLWNVLSQVRASGRTLILTSHSMEECDALCTRLAIMVNGQFKCLGSPQHIKSKFGQGYTLVAKMASQADGRTVSAEGLTQAIFTQFPGTQKFDDHQGYIHFQVPEASIPLSQVFAFMERTKDQELGVEDYSVHQTTLEQVFLTFTRTQYPPREAKPKSVIGQICPCLS